MMKQVIVNGVSYLGVMEQGEDGISVKNAIKTGNVLTTDDFNRYLKEENLGNLENVRFGGNGVSFVEVPLTEDMEMAFSITKLVMERAKKVALKNLENAEFDKGNKNTVINNPVDDNSVNNQKPHWSA